MSFRAFFSLLCLLSVLVACDETSRINPDGENGDIIWVGNGMRLESAHGVLVDIQDFGLGSRSLLLTQDQFLPVVRDVEKNSDVPVRFDWGTKNSSKPIVQLERLDQKAECTRYLSQDGDLVCHEALDSLPIKEGSVPQGLADGSLIYLDLFNSLHHFKSEDEDVLIASDVSDYFVSYTSSSVFARSMSWMCLDLKSGVAQSCEANAFSFSGWEHLVETESGKVLAIQTAIPSLSGVYQLEALEGVWTVSLLKAFGVGWQFLELGESQNSLKFQDASSQEFWLRLTDEGYETLELPKEDVSNIKLQSKNEYTLSSTDLDGKKEFQFCRSDRNQVPHVSKCANLQRSDAYRFSEVLMHYPDELDHPQLIAISVLQGIHEGESPFLISIYEVNLGQDSHPYLVQLSERASGSAISGLRAYDLRPKKLAEF